MKQTIITVLLALVWVTGWAQIKPDTITINFQLASKAKGESATFVYPDFMACDIVALHPTAPSIFKYGMTIRFMV